MESDKDLRLFFGDKLMNEFNGAVDLASTGKQAIKLLKSEKPYDVIISDFKISKGTGLDLLAYKIKNNLEASFIFFTGLPTVKVPDHLFGYSIVGKFGTESLFKSIREVKSIKKDLRYH